jgi:hypothetical protein
VFNATTNKAAIKRTTKKTAVVKEVRHASQGSRGVGLGLVVDFVCVF